MISLRKDLIYLPALLMDMCVGSIILGVTYFASRLGASPLQIGVMASVNTVMYVIFCRIFGKLSDRVQRKRVPQLACLSLSALYLALPLCKQLYQLMVLFPLNGVALAGLWPALEAWIGERDDGRPLIRRVQMFNVAWSLGLVIGYVSGGYIYDLNVFAPFYLGSSAAFIAALALTIQPSAPVTKNFHEETVEVETGRKLTMKYLMVSWASIFIGWMTLGILRYIFPKFIEQLGMPPRVAGLLMLCQTGAQLIMFSILGSTERWHYKFYPLIIFQVLAAVGFISIWFIDIPYMWAFGLILIGLNTGMAYFSSMYYSLSGHADLGNKTGWHESILHSGALVSTITGGALANYVDLKAPYLFCAVVLIVGIPVQMFILKR
ncbi:MFS transporter [Candidatus Poribacteria bacterium]|nr:MFS transporter [Candidatus Poribacteria bacterium]